MERSGQRAVRVFRWLDAVDEHMTGDLRIVDQAVADQVDVAGDVDDDVDPAVHLDGAGAVGNHVAVDEHLEVGGGCRRRARRRSLGVAWARGLQGGVGGAARWIVYVAGRAG